MPRPSLVDVQQAKNQNSWIEKGTGAANTLVSATRTALDGQRHYILQVDASYSASTSSGLLQVKSGTAVIAEKIIHGAGAFDFAEVGVDATNTNEAVSAELAAGGAGVTGYITIMGFTTSE